jgi:hypothetical protein
MNPVTESLRYREEYDKDWLQCETEALDCARQWTELGNKPAAERCLRAARLCRAWIEFNEACASYGALPWWLRLFRLAPEPPRRQR